MASAPGRNQIRSAIDQGQGGRSRRAFGMVGDVISELGKVTWPNRETTTRLTGLVLAIAAAVGVFLSFWDFGFGQLVNWVII